MAYIKFYVKDNVSAQLDGAINSTQTTITIKNGQNLPADGATNAVWTITKFNVNGTINKQEKVLVTNKSGNTLTITRGYDGTTATTFDNDDYIFINVTAKVVQDLQDEVTRLETAKADKSTTLTGYGITNAYTKTEVDNFAVKLTGNQTIAGEKTFSSKIIGTNNFDLTGNLLLTNNNSALVARNDTLKTLQIRKWGSIEPSYGILNSGDSILYSDDGGVKIALEGTNNYFKIATDGANNTRFEIIPGGTIKFAEQQIDAFYGPQAKLINTGGFSFKFKNSSDTMLLEIQEGLYTYLRSLNPFVDNSYSCGQSGNRWSAIWAANGTIQTSDRRQKTEIKETELGLDFISKLNPVSYKWINGSNIVSYEEIEVEKEVQETQIFEYIEEKIEEKDGKFIKIIEKKTREEKVFDEVDLFDEDGNQIFDEREVKEFEEIETEVEKTEIVDGKAIVKIEVVKNKIPVIEYLDVYDENGNQIFDFIPTTKIIQNEDGEDEEIVEMVQTPRKMQKVKTKIEKIPKKAQVPKMVKKLVKEQKEIITSKSGSRNHFGFIAQEVEEALGGVDFGGLVIDENGQYALRYDQFISPLVAAVKELKARVEFLESKIK